MALVTVRKMSDAMLSLDVGEEDLFQENHIFEPEFHQERYVEPCVRISALAGAFQVGDRKLLAAPIARGIQPKYADIEEEPESLEFEGMISADGRVLDDAKGGRNVCALKSNCIRRGYLDFSLARSVSRQFATSRAKRASVARHDVLVNSTGDGTIGRVAVYDFDFPAVVDGHISIVRYKDKDLAWYVAAFLLSRDGQNQLYRYINGSSGQVELYPQDIARIWVKPVDSASMKSIGGKFRAACRKHYDFYKDMMAAFATVEAV